MLPLHDPGRRRLAATSAALAAALLGGCAIVPSGSAAVVVAADGRFRVEREGTHLVSPLAQVRVVDLRAQERNEEMSALTDDGAPLDARAAVMTFHLVPDELESFVRESGPDYYEVLVRPIVRSEVRRALAGRGFSELTTDSIREVQAEVTRIARERLRPHHIELDEVLLKGLIPTAPRTEAEILAGARCEQEVLSMPSALDLARARADERRTHAREIADAHALVASTLTAAVLADDRTRAWQRLLAAASSCVVLEPTPGLRRTTTIVEVNP